MRWDARVARVTLSTSTLTRSQSRPACVKKRRNCTDRKLTFDARPGALLATHYRYASRNSMHING